MKSAWQTAWLILRNDVSPAVVLVPTKLTNEWYRTLVANSITLTPGTVSVDMTKGHYVVLWLAPSGKTADDYYQQIAEPFENMLKKGERRA